MFKYLPDNSGQLRLPVGIGAKDCRAMPAEFQNGSSHETAGGGLDWLFFYHQFKRSNRGEHGRAFPRLKVQQGFQPLPVEFV